eukprot:TRINITY_DN25106_c0_g1_i1.p1 TRINITY_DN25106_c0_g1~~TRINITY_DN25106_c0_g1_i1.p1  ORF type:complete len:140 (-),score=14.26 TRINITY_DN25106_c0_g1_i1:53-472(-)
MVDDQLGISLRDCPRLCHVTAHYLPLDNLSQEIFRAHHGGVASHDTLVPAVRVYKISCENFAVMSPTEVEKAFHIIAKNFIGCLTIIRKVIHNKMDHFVPVIGSLRKAMVDDEKYLSPIIPSTSSSFIPSPIPVWKKRL